MPKIKQILFDCDNTLALSEHLAFEACAELTNELLREYGVNAEYTAKKLLEDFVGQNFRGMMLNLQRIHKFPEPIPADVLEKYVNMEVGRVTAKLAEKCQPCPGVLEQMEWTKDQGYAMAVVSTSAKPRVVASIKKIGIDHYFKDEHVWSAATSLNPPSSKPDPAIYNFAVKELGLKPEDCVAVEDSKSGATAAMKAGIPLIGYVGVYGLEESQEKMEKMAKILTDECKADVIMYDWKEFPECLKKIENRS